MNPKLKQRLEALLKIAQAHYEAGRSMSNNTIGTEREIFVKELLSKIFPNSYRFSSGDIIDSDDHSAGQVDLVLEFPYEPTFPSPVGGERLILAESAICAFEIKSTYPQQWDQLVEKIKKINELSRTLAWNTIQGDGGTQKILIDHLDEHKIPTIGVFYKGPENIETLVDRINTLSLADRPTAILTLDKGFFVYGKIHLSGAEGVLGLVALLSHLSTQIASARSSIDKYIDFDTTEVISPKI
jgi:hypothetical protein